MYCSLKHVDIGFEKPLVLAGTCLVVISQEKVVLTSCNYLE